MKKTIKTRKTVKNSPKRSSKTSLKPVRKSTSIKTRKTL